jgi:toxin ParE1/3/4
MGKVIWSPEALEDVKSIYDFIAKDSADRAALFIERIIESTDCLQNFPNTGRIIKEIGRKECREVIYGSYRIMYEIKGDEVRIAGIVHSARDWKPYK